MTQQLVRNSDPETSHLAAARIERTRPTKKRLVLEHMVRHSPQRWVKHHELTTPDVGGSEGLRRLRELREDWVIHTRPVGKTAWEYRLIGPRVAAEVTR